MKHGRFIAVFVVVAVGFLSELKITCVAADDGDVENLIMPELAEELRLRVDLDQASRKEWIEFGTKHKTFDVDFTTLDPLIFEKFTALTKKMEDQDKQNRIWLKGVVQKHGWPGKSVVGTNGAKNAWLLVQHADQDRDLQQECLTKMEELPKGEVSPKDIAYLTDRVLNGTGKKQKYGTQALLKNGKLILYPIEDEEHVDERRKAIGLGPLAEYVSLMEKSYGISKTADTTEGDGKP